MSYANRNYYKKGTWNAICDVCGFKFKSDQMRKRWDGLMVCNDDWEGDHPQKYLRVKEDKQTVPWVRTGDSTGALTYVTSAPTVDFTANTTTGYAPLTVAFSDLTRPIPLSTWAWNFGDSVTSTSQNPTHIYSTPGTYTVALTVVNTDSITGTDTKANYIVVSDPPMVAAFTYNTNIGNAPLIVNFTDLSQIRASSWSWSLGDGVGTSSVQNPTYTYSTVGLYHAKVTVSNGYNTDSVTHDITVNGAPGSAVKLQLYLNESSGNPIDSALSPNTVLYEADSTYKALQQTTTPGPFDAYSVYLNQGISHTTTNSSNLTFGAAAYMPMTAALRLASGDFSVQAWYRLNSADSTQSGGWIINAGGFGYSFTNGGPPGGQNLPRWGLWAGSDGNITWYQGARPDGGATTHQSISSGATSADTWHLVSVERQGTTLRMWLDGVVVQETPETIPVEQTAAASGYVVVGGIWNQATPRPTMGNFIGLLGGIRVTSGYVQNGQSYTAKWPVPT